MALDALRIYNSSGDTYLHGNKTNHSRWMLTILSTLSKRTFLVFVVGSFSLAETLWLCFSSSILLSSLQLPPCSDVTHSSLRKAVRAVRACLLPLNSSVVVWHYILSPSSRNFSILFRPISRRNITTTSLKVIAFKLFLLPAVFLMLAPLLYMCLKHATSTFETFLFGLSIWVSAVFLSSLHSGLCSMITHSKGFPDSTIKTEIPP